MDTKLHRVGARGKTYEPKAQLNGSQIQKGGHGFIYFYLYRYIYFFFETSLYLLQFFFKKYMFLNKYNICNSTQIDNIYT